MILQERGVNVMLSGANERVTRKLTKAGVIELIGKENSFATFDQAIQYIKTNISICSAEEASSNFVKN